ncbi:hypothetical protein [Paracoccus sp. SCSIO 75233]|uniref:hypothetical protein n=1 Tax=Paracoccus sp. SCSIO 75233 TaxID=3017782 RepID=UPI0022F0B5D8|nr:hypothetical protein [Paracoccus sp. SCSIO 75233]WBU52972.1 hypothetical protein PAF12_14335 [Paracoccus sp. SCSIO 75233]
MKPFRVGEAKRRAYDQVQLSHGECRFLNDDRIPMTFKHRSTECLGGELRRIQHFGSHNAVDNLTEESLRVKQNRRIYFSSDRSTNRGRNADAQE